MSIVRNMTKQTNIDERRFYRNRPENWKLLVHLIRLPFVYPTIYIRRRIALNGVINFQSHIFGSRFQAISIAVSVWRIQNQWSLWTEQRAKEGENVDGRQSNSSTPAQESAKCVHWYFWKHIKTNNNAMPRHVYIVIHTWVKMAERAYNKNRFSECETRERENKCKRINIPSHTYQLEIERWSAFGLRRLCCQFLDIWYSQGNNKCDLRRKFL